MRVCRSGLWGHDFLKNCEVFALKPCILEVIESVAD